jgi:cyclopropane fatty-acyl-phospholipid synthase-like methyltransferase
MRQLDKRLQGARLRRAARHIAVESSVLDIGCHQGELGEHLATRANVRYVGIDPHLATASQNLVRGRFPDDVPAGWSTFDHVVALAVLEHVQHEQLARFLDAARSLLRPGGTMIATVPSPLADKVLDILHAARLIDGMDLDAHHGVTISQLLDGASAAGLDLERHDRFQLRLNNLIVWRRRAID